MTTMTTAPTDLESTKNTKDPEWPSVRVVYVQKQNAKAAKMALEEAGLLDKDFRMVPATDVRVDAIALPVSIEENDHDDDDDREPWNMPHGPWSQYIVCTGRQPCPFATKRMGNRSQAVPPPKQGQTPCTLVQQAILETIRAQSTTTISKTQEIVIFQQLKGLGPVVCPKKLTYFGDDRTLVIPPGSFQGAAFVELLTVDWEKETSNVLPAQHEFWKQLASIHGSPRIVRKGTVDPESGIRESGHRWIYPPLPALASLRDGIPKETGPGAPGWICITEQGIKQWLDMTRVMFSRGNISEKIRFGKLVQEGERVLDMYAGIGFYTLPALVHGKASHVVACEWNDHALQALRYNIHDNHLEDRATVLPGDCRISLQQEDWLVHPNFDRISLGLLPSSEGGWETAIRALNEERGGGWLHIHANVPNKEKEDWTLWLCHRLYHLCHQVVGRPSSWIVVCNHVESVKSFAPTVSHYVADVYVGTVEGYPHRVAIDEIDPGLDAGTYHRNPDGTFASCQGRTVSVPSCALSPDGVLSQAWMR